MNITLPSVQIINEKDMFKKIELAGRVCYKSEDKITSDSAEKFFYNLLKRKHYSVLEHYVECWVANNVTLSQSQMLERYYGNIPHSNLTVTHIRGNKYRVIFSANLRVLLENEMVVFDEESGVITHRVNSLFSRCDFETDIQNKTPDEIRHHRYATISIVTDRGVTHELVRHRKFSFSQESTRYVNYKNKGLTFIQPMFVTNEILDKEFTNFCKMIEEIYVGAIDSGLKPQDARAFLPNCVKTEIVVTGNDEEWQHFFKLRCSEAAHPDMQCVADLVQTIYEIYYKEENK